MVRGRFLERLRRHDLEQHWNVSFAPSWRQQQEMITLRRGPPGGFEEPFCEKLVGKRRPRENIFALLQHRFCIGGCIQNPAMQLDAIPADAEACFCNFCQLDRPIPDCRAKLGNDVQVQELIQLRFRIRSSDLGRAARLLNKRCAFVARVFCIGRFFGRTGTPASRIIGEGRRTRSCLRRSCRQYGLHESFLVIASQASGSRRSRNGLSLSCFCVAVELRLDVVRPTEFAVHQQLLGRGFLGILVHNLAQDVVQIAHQNFGDPTQSSFHRRVERLPRRSFHDGGLGHGCASQSQKDIRDCRGLPAAGQEGSGFGEQLADQNAPRNLRFPQAADAFLDVRQGQLQPEEHHLNRPPQKGGGKCLPG